MSKEEFLKIQTCVLKVNIHCDGCKHKVKKILQKIEGVYTTNIDSDLGKVTVSGNVDPATLIKKLAKSGKHAELWGAPKNNNQQQQLNHQFKNLNLDNGGKGGNNKGQKGNNTNNHHQPPKGGGGGQPGQNPNQIQNQQLQQLAQMKGFPDLKLPQFKDLKMPFAKDSNQKAVKFNVSEIDDDDGSEFDEFDDDDDYDDDDLDDEDDGPPMGKMKPPVMGGGHQMPNMLMNGGMGAQQHQQLLNAQAKGGNGGNNGGNGQKGSGGNVPVQLNGKGAGGGNANGGKKGGNGGGGNQNQAGGGAVKNGGKNGVGGLASDGKGGNHGGGAPGKGGNGGAMGGGGGGKKGGGNGMGMDGVPGMPKLNNGYPNMGGMTGMGGGNLGPMSMGSGPMGTMPAVQGLPAAVHGGAGGPGPGYYHGAGPEVMAGNPYYQQQLAAMMMNQQRANGNERFQPMMYARPPAAVNYMPPYPYPYPPPPPPGEPYAHMFSDENTSSCNVM